METIAGFLLLCFFAFIVYGITTISQSMDIRKFEKKQLLPLVQSLYDNPDNSEKHKRFFQEFEDIEVKIKKYKKEIFQYNPNVELMIALIEHIDRYPKDNKGLERLDFIIEKADTFNDCKVLQKLINCIDQYPKHLYLHDQFLDIIDKTQSLTLNLYSENFFVPLFEHINYYPRSKYAHRRLENCTAKATALSNNLLEYFLQYLSRFPTHPVVQITFLDGISKIKLISPEQSRSIYETSLQILEQYPDHPNGRKFCLAVGRWHFSHIRLDGKVTIYDEQAIQNDINVRTYN